MGRVNVSIQNSSKMLSSHLFFKSDLSKTVPVCSLYQLNGSQLFVVSSNPISVELKHWIPLHGGTLDEPQSIFCKHLHHALRCTHLSASLCQGKRNRSSFLALTRVQLFLQQKLGFAVNLAKPRLRSHFPKETLPSSVHLETMPPDKKNGWKKEEEKYKQLERWMKLEKYAW